MNSLSVKERDRLVWVGVGHWVREHHFIHRSKYTDPMYPPRIALDTFCSNRRRLFCRTSAASLLRGSSGLGS